MKPQSPFEASQTLQSVEFFIPLSSLWQGGELVCHTETLSGTFRACPRTLRTLGRIKPPKDDGVHGMVKTAHPFFHPEDGGAYNLALDFGPTWNRQRGAWVRPLGALSFSMHLIGPFLAFASHRNPANSQRVSCKLALLHACMYSTSLLHSLITTSYFPPFLTSPFQKSPEITLYRQDACDPVGPRTTVASLPFLRPSAPTWIHQIGVSRGHAIVIQNPVRAPSSTRFYSTRLFNRCVHFLVLC
jgi:hypothetical protein